MQYLHATLILWVSFLCCLSTQETDMAIHMLHSSLLHQKKLVLDKLIRPLPCESATSLLWPHQHACRESRMSIMHYGICRWAQCAAMGAGC